MQTDREAITVASNVSVLLSADERISHFPRSCTLMMMMVMLRLQVFVF